MFALATSLWSGHQRLASYMGDTDYFSSSWLQLGPAQIMWVFRSRPWMGSLCLWLSSKYYFSEVIYGTISLLYQVSLFFSLASLSYFSSVLLSTIPVKYLKIFREKRSFNYKVLNSARGILTLQKQVL